MISFKIQQEQDIGLRLDRFLVSRLPDYSRSKIQAWIKSGSILVNGEMRKTGYSLEINDSILVQIDGPKIQSDNLVPESMDLDILYEDEFIAVINKPAKMIVHPGIGNSSGTLVNGLLYYFKKLSNINGQFRPGIVHRLDGDTSGVILIAKSNQAHAFIANQFQTRSVTKNYTAIVWGTLMEDEGEIDNPIGRKGNDPTSYTISKNGKNAITQFKVLSRFRHLSKVSFSPKTGRTHQIRVHSAYLGFPIFGDEKYGGGLKKTRGFLPEFTKFYQKELNKFNRHALHASRIEFIHPESKKHVVYEAPLPQEFLNLNMAIELYYDG